MKITEKKIVGGMTIERSIEVDIEEKLPMKEILKQANEAWKDFDKKAIEEL